MGCSWRLKPKTSALLATQSTHRRPSERQNTSADGTAIDYAHSAHGELQTVTIPGEGSISVNQFKWTAPTSLTLPGGTVQDKSYNGLLQLKSLKVKGPGQQTTLDFQHRYG